jgi:hypothetical protein
VGLPLLLNLEDYPGVLRRVLETLPEDTKLLFGHQSGVGGTDAPRESLEAFDGILPQIEAGISAGKERAELELIQFAYWLILNKKRTQDARAVFAFGVELFPDAWNTYDSLAEAYAVLGERDQAIR